MHTFEDLPIEIKELIIEYTPRSFRAFCGMQVCRLWCKIILDMEEEPMTEIPKLDDKVPISIKIFSVFRRMWNKLRNMEESTEDASELDTNLDAENEIKIRNGPGVVVDIGTQTTKMGYMDSDGVRLHFDSFVVRYPVRLIGVGQSAVHRGIYDRHMSFPFRRGGTELGSDHALEDIKHIVLHGLYRENGHLVKDREECPSHLVLLYSHLLEDGTFFEHAVQMLFETFHVGKLMLVNKYLATLAAYGKMTGLVISSGVDATTIVPILGGCVAHGDRCRKIEIASDAVRDVLLDFMRQNKAQDNWLEDSAWDGRVSNVSQSGLRRTVNDIKEECGRVAITDTELNTDCGNSSRVQFRYQYSRSGVEIGNERFLCTEILFHPEMINMDRNLGIAQQVHEVISLFEEEEQRSLYGNIVLDGGTTQFPGFDTRLTLELKRLAPSGMRICVRHVRNDQKLSSFHGAQIVSHLPQLAPFWATKAEYDAKFDSAVLARREMLS